MLADVISNIVSIIFIAIVVTVPIAAGVVYVTLRWADNMDRRLGIGGYAHDPFPASATLPDVQAHWRREVPLRLIPPAVILISVGMVFAGMLYSITQRSDLVPYAVHATVLVVLFATPFIVPVGVAVYLCGWAGKEHQYRYWRERGSYEAGNDMQPEASR